MVRRFSAFPAYDVPAVREFPPFDTVKSPAMSRLSVSQIMTSRWSFEHGLRSFQAAEFSAVGLWRPRVAQFGEDKAVELVRELEMPVSSLSWAGGFTGANGASFFDAIDDARRAVRRPAD